MGIINCKKCGRIFADDGFDFCPICRNTEDEMFKKVKDYLYEYPGASVQQVSEETGVDAKKILKFLREGKLEIKDDSPNLILDCERCGTPIKTGRFCNKCIAEMQKEFKGAITPKEESSHVRRGNKSDKMYIAGRHKR
jgi:flagellar operon protein (TIGR03826 family)